jgi:ADP-ribose pyrophosphatase
MESLETMSGFPRKPEPAVGASVRRRNRVLLVKRRRSPGEGLWAIPGGRVHLGETLQEAAEREVFEETGIIVAAGEAIYTFDLIDVDERGRVIFHYIIVDLMAEYRGGFLRPGDDASEACWVTPEEMVNLPMADKTRQILEDLLNRT